MKSFEIELPDTLELDVMDVRFIIALKLYEQSKISLGE